MDKAPKIPSKKPGKAIEIAKKVARVFAVGTTLAGVPTDTKAMNIDGWRRSTNVEDFRNKANKPKAPQLGYSLRGAPGPVFGDNSTVQEQRREPGMFDKDIEDAATRIKAEVAAEEAAKQAKIEAEQAKIAEAFEEYKKTIDDKIKKEAEQRPTIIVGRPKR